MSFYARVSQYLVSRYSVFRPNAEHRAYHFRQIGRISVWNRLENSGFHFFIQVLQVGGLERWFESCHFVKNTAKRPYVAFHIVGMVLPHLRAGVIRSASLGVCEPSLHDFRDVEVSQLIGIIFADENICRFDVSMQYFFVVERLKASAYV